MLFNECIPSETSFDWIDFIEKIAAPITIIAIFGIERFLNRQENREKQKRDWYLNVIVYPNLDRVNTFFRIFSEETTVKLEKFNESLKEDLAFSKLNMLKAKEFQSIRHLKHDFDNEFLTLVLVFDRELGLQLRSIIGQLEDNLIDYIDSMKAEKTEQDLFKFQEEIKNNQYLFHSILYSKIGN